MQTIVLYLCYIVLILLLSTAYNTSLIYCFVIWCLHTNKRRPCSSTLSGHPSSSSFVCLFHWPRAGGRSKFEAAHVARSWSPVQCLKAFRSITFFSDCQAPLRPDICRCFWNHLKSALFCIPEFPKFRKIPQHSTCVDKGIWEAAEGVA